jgi:hypothetical protein
VLEPILVKTVSKYTVSFENERLPELNSTEKSFLHEENTDNVKAHKKVT